MTELTQEQVQETMTRLIKPITESIEKCQSVEEIIMLASIMITTGQEIMESAVGRDNANQMLSDLVKK
jgi:hypothetical protein